MNGFVNTCGAVICLEIGLISLLMIMPKLGHFGKDISEACTKAPTLDLIVSAFTWIPWVIAGLVVGWGGFFGAVIGQIGVMQLWIVIHEFIHRQKTGKRQIVSYLDQRFGWWRNHLGLWITSFSLPLFFILRLTEIFIYPFLIWLLGFPSYKQSEWVNVSRQKFDGLVGHDLIWCWYCDWMTGVYSLGAEMLRNVESFWCPIRFHYDKKCENCKIDFPDIDGGWVAADGTMEDVVKTLDEQMPTDHGWSWFGHPKRSEIED